MHPSIHPGLLVSTFLFKGGKGQKRKGRRRWKLGSSSASCRRPIDPLNFRVFFPSPATFARFWYKYIPEQNALAASAAVLPRWS